MRAARLTPFGEEFHISAGEGILKKKNIFQIKIEETKTNKHFFFRFSSRLPPFESMLLALTLQNRFSSASAAFSVSEKRAAEENDHKILKKTFSFLLSGLLFRSFGF